MKPHYKLFPDPWLVKIEPTSQHPKRSVHDYYARLQLVFREILGFLVRDANAQRRFNSILGDGLDEDLFFCLRVLKPYKWFSSPSPFNFS